MQELFAKERSQQRGHAEHRCEYCHDARKHIQGIDVVHVHRVLPVDAVYLCALLIVVGVDDYCHRLDTLSP